MKPVIGIISDTYTKGPHLYHSVGDKYIRAVTRAMDAIPFMIPALGKDLDVDDLLQVVDGFLIPGGYSNIERERYGLPAADSDENQDPNRDDTTLSLLPKIIDAGVPMLGICRGLQELNVAYGGTLNPRIHEQEGRMDHREPAGPVEVQYGPAHDVHVAKDGLLHSIVGEEKFMVNTVHMQAIDKLADCLTVEAEAPDGTIEAVSMPSAAAFMLAVQWHPEWLAWDNPQSSAIFTAFKQAALKYKGSK